MREYQVGVIVRATIPANSAIDAVSLLCQMVREGLGPEAEDGHREFDASISSSMARAIDGSDGDMRINEQMLRDLADDLRRPR